MTDGSIRQGQNKSHDQRARSAGTFGMKLFLASLSMLFAGSFIGYLVVRLRAQDWRTEDLPALPAGLWISTAILLLCSLFVHRALKSIRQDNQSGLRTSLLISFILGLGFLVNQTINWLSLIEANLAPNSRNLYAFTFYMLTGLHAAHVIGGLIQKGIVTVKSYRGVYSHDYHPGVTYTAMYWHFLDVIWIVMFVIMQFLS